MRPENMRLACTCVIFMALLTTFSGEPNFAQKRDSEYQLWLVRSQTLTTDLLKDAADLSSMQRAVLWVKLGQRWWREDPKRARTWVTNAIEVVEQVPNKETPEERQERMETASIILAIVTPLDQKLSKQLLTVLASGKSTDSERAIAANALIDAAIAVVKDDPKRAGELGALALRTGSPNNNIRELLFPLRARDPKLADSLFVQSLALVKQDPHSRLLNSLLYVAFPAQRGISDDVPVPPDALRMELLQVLVDLLNARPAGGENSNCGVVAWISPYFSEIERLLPKQWPVVRSAINQCQSSPSLDQLTQRHIDEATHAQPLDTVESFLKAAADAKDTEVRTGYQYRAANLAMEHKDYERALKLLDDMPKEERGETWDSYRWQWAADGAIEHYKNSRFGEMNRMLDAVPLDFQPLAKTAFIQWLPEGAVSETAPIIHILNDALKGLRRSNIPEKYHWYFGLLRSTIKYQPADANAVLKDTIASLNQVKEETPLDATDYLRYMGPPLLEMDEFVVKDALASITLVPMRVQLRLSLLNATLQRMRDAQSVAK
jgi:hypothetical protein